MNNTKENCFKCNQLDLLEIQKFWDIRAKEYNESDQKEKFKLVDQLISKDVINKKYNVLDVGCGTGKYIIEFAKNARDVTGIDISPNMISYAKKNAEDKKLKNVSFKVMPWQELDVKKMKWNKKFDFVFSNMSPAIKSEKDVLKMNEVSRKYCFMSSAVYRKDKVRDELFKKLIGEKYNKKDKKNICYNTFNLLWNMGIYPEITYNDVVWTNKMSNKTAVEMFTIMLQNVNKEDDCLKEKIKAYIEDISYDGKIKEVIDAKIAWMLWKVD